MASRPDSPARPSRWSIGYFGIKDVFTIINLLGGIGGLYFAFHGRLDWAGFSIFLGYVLGDVLDGPVARLTNTQNQFGREFDSAADHLSQGIVPPVIVYAAYRQGGHEALGTFLLAFLILTATMRMTRFAVAEFDYPLTYCGLPRTVSGLMAIALPNSLLFFRHGVLGYEGCAAVLVLFGVLNLVPIPYMTHKGARKMQLYVKLLVGGFLVVPSVMIFMAREFVFDVLVVITFGYAVGAWIPLRPEERRAYWAEYKRWAAEVANRK